MGPSSFLTETEEDTLVKWILIIAKPGFPVIKEDLLCTVQKIIELSNLKTPFTNSIREKMVSIIFGSSP